jgi:hypothetical protein
MATRKYRQSVVRQTTEMQHFFRDGRGVREEVDFCGVFLGAEFRNQEFGFFSDED